jgi:alkylation response protein AidB-like acyl-CoA dehydrogenase
VNTLSARPATAVPLDRVLGDPWHTDNPLGYAAVLAADERGEMLAEGERLLTRFGLNAEFVPGEYDGRFVRADRLADTLRALWRRDPCLGLGYGLSSLIASMNVWTCGAESQRRWVARLLLNGGRVAAAFHELDHGNDLGSAECFAHPSSTGWLVTGRKEVVANLHRAEAMVLFARTGSKGGSRGHTQFLVERASLPAGRVSDLPRIHSSGMRGVQLDGMRFEDCPVPAQALLGQVGQGMEIVLRSYLVTRSVVPAVIIGPLDTALRLTLDYALDRQLYRGAVADIPYVRTVIARAFADLLAADALSSVTVRGLHLVPETMAVYAPAAKYLVSGMVVDAFSALRSVLGTQAYLRGGRFAMFQKLARDIPPATFGHISRSACLVTILPQLPRLARTSWGRGDPANEAIFDLGGPLPVLRLDRLDPAARGDDVLAGTLNALAGSADATLEGRYAARFAETLGALRAHCLALAPRDLTINASPAAFALADRYTVVLAAASALAVWRRAGDRLPREVLLGVLDRLDGRLGGQPVLSPVEREETEGKLFALALERFRDGTSLDLSARPIFPC